MLYRVKLPGIDLKPRALSSPKTSRRLGKEGSLCAERVRKQCKHAINKCTCRGFFSVKKICRDPKFLYVFFDSLMKFSTRSSFLHMLQINPHFHQSHSTLFQYLFLRTFLLLCRRQRFQFVPLRMFDGAVDHCHRDSPKNIDNSSSTPN